MQLQGETDNVITPLGRGDLKAAEISAAERVLLELVELLTRHAYKTTAADIERLRSAGWSDEQIAEAVYITALFALFNRVADAFGLQDPQYRESFASGKPAPHPAEKPRPDG